MDSVTIYGLKQSVYTQIALLALEEKKIAYTLETLNVFKKYGRHKAAHLHPFAKIPVLIHGDFKLYETSVITQYVDECFDGKSLTPSDNKQRARMSQIIALFDSYAYKPMIWGLFVQNVTLKEQGRAPDPTIVNNALRMAKICLNSVTDLINDNPFLAGKVISRADLHTFPILNYLSLTPEGSELLPKYTKISAWMKEMAKRPSVKKVSINY